MARKKFGIAVLATVTILVASAFAQRSNEVAGSIGRSIISDEGVSGIVSGNPNVHFGQAWTYEGNFSHRFFNFGIAAISVEIPVVYDPKTKVQFGPSNSVPKDFSAYFLTPAARVNLFPTTALSPWVSVGAGFARFNPNTTLEFGGGSAAVSQTNAVFQVGGGLDVGPWDHFKIRGEIRDFNSSEPPINLNKSNRYSHIFAGLGLVFSF
jgi:opacity protein-like surface antigen